MNNHVIISGCSGGGKSSVIAELAARGYTVIEEPGRRIIKEENETGSTNYLPWMNLRNFAERAIELSIADIKSAGDTQDWIFFDRGLIDAIAAFQFASGESVMEKLKGFDFYPKVFLTPPWKEIFHSDSERQHSLEMAVNEYDRLFETYTSLGFEIVLLPKVSIPQRADFILTQISNSIFSPEF